MATVPATATTRLFERITNLATAAVEMERQVRDAARAARARNIAGDLHLSDLHLTNVVDIDGFFAEQFAAMQANGHWAFVMPYNSTHNHSAILKYVPTSGEQPVSAFGPRNYTNTVSMRIRAERDGNVYCEIYSHQCCYTSTRVTAAAVTRAMMEAWFAEFVRAAVRFAAINPINQ